MPEFKELEQAWDDLYKSRYGYWRAYVMTVIYNLKYGITGMAGAWYWLLATTKNETLIIAIPWPEFHIKA